MEYTAANQTTFGCPAGGPSAIPPEFGDLVNDLAECSRSATLRLGERLHQARAAHDLSRSELVKAQRDVARLHRIGALPSPNEYWKRSALPRAATMIDESMSAVVEEGELLGTALDRFMLDLDRSPLQGWGSSTAGKATVDHVTSEAIGQLMDAVPSDESINALGLWWQRRLRRAATVASMPRLLIAGAKADALIGGREMELLDRPPWSHGDRLLSAFELANSEIKTQTELVMEGLSARVARRGKTYIAPVQRVTIELRD